jgi:mRNA-degrading endonuclease RelE of RelBE toxin-antitoxin system
MAFRIELNQRAHDNLNGLHKRDQRNSVDAIVGQLTHEPQRPTRNRKKLEENEVTPWELRVGDWRAFYDIDQENEVVVILEIGQKTHNTLRIGGEEIDL